MTTHRRLSGAFRHLLRGCSWALLLACSADAPAPETPEVGTADALDFDAGETAEQDAGGDSDTGDDDVSAPGDATEPDASAACFDPDDDQHGDGCAAGADCNDGNPEVFAGAPELCGDGLDNDCDGRADEDCACQESSVERCFDGDEGFRGVGACREGLRTCVSGSWGACDNPTPTEDICDRQDNDCDGQTDEGVTNACGLCGAVDLEVCGDGLDNDCDGAIDNIDGCTCGGRVSQPCYSGPPPTLGYGTCLSGVSLCVGDVLVACEGERLPEVEVCDGLDNDCDGETDEGLANACGVCGMPTPLEVCDGVDNDCDGEVDELLLTRCGQCGPTGSPEICDDGVDNNCDGNVDEACGCGGGVGCWPGVPEQRAVGECADGERTCVGGEFWGSCESARLPTPEVCDGLDNDCDGQADEGDDGCSVCGSEAEVCDGLDNDCDGQIDEFLRNACGSCNDGVQTEESCGVDCCDGIDNDCDGFVDEGLLNACGLCDRACETARWGVSGVPWSDGVLRGVDTRSDQVLRLGTTFVGLPFVWVANSGEGSVSKINTETGEEVGRFPVGQSPSRTAVDFGGNVYVANRAFDGQGTVSRVDAEGCVGEACVRYTAPVGATDAVPRGMAIDQDGFPWVGTYNDNSLRRLDPETGLVLDSYDVGLPVYGIAIDAEGMIWFSSLRIPDFSGGSIGAFDPRAERVAGVWEIPGCSNPYGLAVDAAGALWIGNFTCDSLVRFDRETFEFDIYDQFGLSRVRGVAVDGDGFVWAVSYGTNRVVRFDPNAERLVASTEVCSGPTGVGIAEDGKAWIPCYGDDTVVSVSAAGEVVDTVNVGVNPYSYSDMTGFQLRNFTALRGVWTSRFDCGGQGCRFYETDWLGETAPGTGISLRVRSSADAESWTNWAGPFETSPVSLSGLPAARYLELELTLRTSDRDTTPLVDELSLLWAAP
ncbi:MAG: streptogramin lyase [Bradymonadia bacterium]|jgi:streptogramin lyase